MEKKMRSVSTTDEEIEQNRLKRNAQTHLTEYCCGNFITLVFKKENIWILRLNTTILNNLMSVCRTSLWMLGKVMDNVI